MHFLTRFGIPTVLSLLVCVVSFAQVTPNSVAMEVVHGKPYVQVLVNGRGPFRFVVDTGTGAEAILSPALADVLKLPVAGHARLTDPSGLGEQRAEILEIDSLKVAGADFTAVKAIRHRLSGEDDSCMGLLGFTLFRHYLLTLDYPNHRLTLAQGALVPDGEQSVLPFRMPDGVPIAALRIAGQRVEAQLDSGGLGLTLPESLAVRLKFSRDPVLFGNGQSLATRFQVKAGRLNSDVRVGRYTFARPVVEIHPAFPLVNFGACPMENFTITFDQDRLLVRLDAQGKVFHLDTLPTIQGLENTERLKPDIALVPVG
jgi:predicted aspartyl protease